jgi:putative membrane-bound dehydrogenase-like protein
MGSKSFMQSAGHVFVAAWLVVVSVRPDALAAQSVPSPPPLDAASSLAQARVQPGYCLQLMAAEPLVADPVAIDWDADGRLWVAEMADYPYGMDGRGEPGGRIRCLTDTDGDGVYDRSVVFMDGVSFPTGVMPWRDGVLVTAAPELFFAADSDGDGRADRRQVLFRGFIEGNQQLRVNGLRYGLDNWVYCAAGGHHPGFGADNSIENVSTGERVPLGSRDFRFRPDSGQLDPLSGPSQFGRVRDDWGNWFGVQNSYPLWHYVLEDTQLRRNPSGRYGDVRQQLRLPANPAVYPASFQEKRYHSFEQSGHYTSACGPCIYRDDKLFSGRGVTHAFTCEPFHNVVQHHELLDDGVSFRGQRAATLSPYDFYASADRWSRPVMTRTGPDGALWIVDMYRFMIEHPDWLPEEGREELKPFYRSGEGMGRIYRVYPSSSPPPRIPALRSLDDRQLVDQLASSNGPIRDLAQRLLIERQVSAQQGRLESMASTHADPRARLHALATLDGRGCLSDSLLQRALRDDHPLVRRHALRLAEARAADAPELLAAIVDLARDRSPKVRLQLLLSLGEIPGPAADECLWQLADQTSGDRWLTAALASSLPAHVPALVAGVEQGRTLPPDIVAALLQLTTDRPRLLARLLAGLVPREPAAADAETLTRCAQWVASFQEQGRDPRDVAPADRAVLSQAVARFDALLDHCWTLASDASRPLPLRVAALDLARYDRPTSRRAHRGQLSDLLAPATASAIQRCAVRILIADRDAEAVELLLNAWPSFLPATRADVVDGLMGDPRALQKLLERMAEAEIGLQDVDAVRRDRLLHHQHAQVAAQARALFAQSVSTDRAAVLDRYGPSLQRDGDATRGARLFTKHCATCHAPEQGVAIGPDLRSLTDRSPQSLLVAILDPSRAVEPRYLAYHAELKTGEVVYGLVVGESGGTLRLRPLEGPTRELLRESIEQLESSRRSFMPDGLEAELSVQDLADLILHVQQLK